MTSSACFALRATETRACAIDVARAPSRMRGLGRYAGRSRRHIGLGARPVAPESRAYYSLPCEDCDANTNDPVREGLERPCRPQRRRRARPALHRPPPRPRGHVAAGIRVARDARPAGAPARPDSGHRRSRRANRGPRPRDPGPAVPQADRDAGRELRAQRHHAVRHRRPAAGHRPRHRPRAGHHAAGHDDRLRRLPHLDPRRIRGACLRHRHVRGRARARHPDAAPGPAEVDGDHRRR